MAAHLERLVSLGCSPLSQTGFVCLDKPMFSRQVNTGQAGKAAAAGGGERVRSEPVIFPLQFGRKEPDMAVSVLIERGWAESAWFVCM